jgi:hypothetical protein
LIQTGLDEAKNDFKELGRPLTFRVHDGEYPSLLSDAFKDGNNVSMTGVVNLLVILLVITNIKNVIISYEKYGFTLS